MGFHGVMQGYTTPVHYITGVLRCVALCRVVVLCCVVLYCVVALLYCDRTLRRCRIQHGRHLRLLFNSFRLHSLSRSLAVVA